MPDNTAESQALAQVESIVAMVAALNVNYERLEELRDMQSALEQDVDAEGMSWVEVAELTELEEAAGECTNEDDARNRITEDALSVEVRSGWTSSKDDFEPEEFRIVLCTGGPHVEIVGDIDRGTPSRVRVLYRDWGTSGELFDFDHGAVIEYCHQFYFGE